MAESNGLLNRRTGNRTGGSNPPLSAIFILKKNENGERRRKSSLHCAVRHNFTQKTKFFLHIFTKPQRSLTCEDAPGFISLRRGKPFQSLVKWSAALPVKFSPSGSKDSVTFILCYAYTAASRLDFLFCSDILFLERR